MPGWLIASLLGIGGFAVGVLATIAVLRERRQGGDLDQDGLLPAVDPESAAESREEPAERMNGGLHLVGLIGQALRPALLRLRRESVAPVLVEEFEHVAWQARMLTSHPRPMQAQPSSTIALLQEAAEQVEPLKFRIVGVDEVVVVLVLGSLKPRLQFWLAPIEQCVDLVSRQGEQL